GINIAQRIMDCGDAGHILVSKHAAGDLEQYDQWQPYLHDLGECEVKHGERLHVVNFYNHGIGNPAVPEKFARNRIAGTVPSALKVISRTSTQKYKSTPGNLREIGQELGVAHFLEGSVQKVANAVHVNVQLIRAATAEHLWAESYNRKLDDVFGVEGEVANAI